MSILPVLWCREGTIVEIDHAEPVPRELAFGSMIVTRQSVAYQSAGVVRVNGQEFVVLYEQAMLERLTAVPRITALEDGQLIQRRQDGEPVIEFVGA